jgi:hypothetical protein
MYSSTIKAILSLMLVQTVLVNSVEGSDHDKKGVGHRHNLYKARLSEGEIYSSVASASPSAFRAAKADSSRASFSVLLIFIASERIKRAQANAHNLPKKHNKRLASATYTSTGTSSAPNTVATKPAYVGRQNDTSTCTNQPTSDGCTDPVYTVIGTEVDLANGGTIQPNGHVNFQVSVLALV